MLPLTDLLKNFISKHLNNKKKTNVVTKKKKNVQVIFMKEYKSFEQVYGVQNIRPLKKK